MQPMFRPGASSLVAKLLREPDSRFHATVVEVETVVRGGVASGEFRDVGDVRLAVEVPRPQDKLARAAREQHAVDLGAPPAAAARSPQADEQLSRRRFSAKIWMPARLGTHCGNPCEQC